MKKLSSFKTVCIVCVFCVATTIPLPAQVFTTLHSFDRSDGVFPMAGLIQASDGNFYGTTKEGGTNCSEYGGCGTVFKITPSGTLTTLYSFCPQGYPCPDGAYP